MEDLPTEFERFAKRLTAQHPELSIKWESIARSGKRLTIFKKDESGFDVVVEAEPYGLYPYAGDWHGPAWDLISKEETYGELCEQFMGFIRSLLCEDSQLEVRYAGSWPYRWLLTYPTEDGFKTEETGLFIFNYFGARSRRVLQNHHLPPRYK